MKEETKEDLNEVSVEDLDEELKKELEQKPYYEEIIDLAMRYMEDKYNVSFTPVSYGISAYLSSKDTVECVADGMDADRERIFVSVEKRKTENTEQDPIYEYHDSYYGWLIRSAMEEAVLRVFKTEFEKIKVFRDAINFPLPDRLGAESSLDDFYVELPSYRMCVKVYVRRDSNLTDEEFERRMNNIAGKLIETGHRYTLHVMAVSDSVFDKADRFFDMNEMGSSEEEQGCYTWYATISDREVHRYG